MSPQELVSPSVKWSTYADRKTALFVDLPDKRSVLEEFALARMGFRPISLNNGVYGARKRIMAEVMYQETNFLSGLSIRSDALPVFLLNAGRYVLHIMKASYTNFWPPWG